MRRNNRARNNKEGGGGEGDVMCMSHSYSSCVTLGVCRTRTVLVVAVVYSSSNSSSITKREEHVQQ